VCLRRPPTFTRRRAAGTGEEFVAFDAVGEYDEYVDGKPRYEGVRSFLDSRGIDLPQGDPGDGQALRRSTGLATARTRLC
jgi:hypothetical protein